MPKHSFTASPRAAIPTPPPQSIPCCRFSLYDEAQLQRGLSKPEYTQVLNILLPTGMSFLENHKYFCQNTDLKEQSWEDEWTPTVNSFPSTMAWDYYCLHWCFKASFYLYKMSENRSEIQWHMYARGRTATTVTTALSHLERRANPSVNTRCSNITWSKPAMPEGQACHNVRQTLKSALAW